MALQTPRVLPEHLQAFHPSSAGGRSTSTVRLLGTVSALHGETATITCGNNGDVTLALQPNSHLQMGKLVEVIGKVMDLDGGVCFYFFWNLDFQLCRSRSMKIADLCGFRVLVLECLGRWIGGIRRIVVCILCSLCCVPCSLRNPLGWLFVAIAVRC